MRDISKGIMSTLAGVGRTTLPRLAELEQNRADAECWNGWINMLRELFRGPSAVKPWPSRGAVSRALSQLQRGGYVSMTRGFPPSWEVLYELTGRGRSYLSHLQSDLPWPTSPSSVID